MKLQTIKLCSPVCAVFFAMVVPGASSALAKPRAAAQAPAPRRPPTVLQGALVATEAKARELAWHSYVLSMGGEPGALDKDRVQGIACYTLGANVLDYAQKGEKVWEVRIVDASADLRAIIWVHSATREIKFLVSPEVTNLSHFHFESDDGKAVVPDAAGVKGVVIRKLKNEWLDAQAARNGEAARQTISAAQFKEMLSTAEPVTQKMLNGMAFGASDEYKGSFEAPDGVYYFSLSQGIMSLYTPGGEWGRFSLQPAPAK